jgi:rhamnogalacturonan endolyase
VIWRSENNQQLQIYTTTVHTDMRQFTLMHDPQYRVAIAWQNVAYNQPPHPSFYLGEGMSVPPQPDIYLAGGTSDHSEAGGNITDINDMTDTNDYKSLVVEENDPGYCGVDGAIDNNHDGYTGGGFSNTDNALSNGVEWAINIPQNGTYKMSWRYANGSSTNRTAHLLVDGTAVISNVSFNSTGSWSNWNSAATDVTMSVGSHLVRLQASTSEGLSNIDSLEVSGTNPQTAQCGGGSGSSQRN